VNLVESTKNVMVHTGAQAVLWLLFGLSVVSLAIIVERAVAFFRARGSVDALRAALGQAFRAGGLEAARRAMAQSPHPAAQVVLRGMSVRGGARPTPKEAEEAMGAELANQKTKLDQGLGVLATLGSNSPFIGLFGTVVGIVGAFDALGKQGGVGAASAGVVMASIGEALVATAVGIGVAVPAVIAFNFFSRRAKASLGGAEVLSRELLAYLEGGSHGDQHSVGE
jgi:biopolymer transport protein ExbB